MSEISPMKAILPHVKKYSSLVITGHPNKSAFKYYGMNIRKKGLFWPIKLDVLLCNSYTEMTLRGNILHYAMRLLTGMHEN